ncbi:hypothetical protein KGM48_01560 [Patescibacteria group bacterium]|nr:hypothetical protein [Patescibacteria group bacterium]
MRYTVVFAPFTDRHFVRTFAKKYKNAWEKTQKALAVEFTFVDSLFEKSIAETMSVSADNDTRICKTEFKILGTEVSRHASGNRCIIAVLSRTAVVHVLLVYSKGDIGGPNETAGWKAVVKDNYPEYRNLL